VLIDYLQADASIIRVLVEHIGPLHVTSSLIEEINDIDDENELTGLGLIVIEPNIEEFSYSSTGPLSFHDQLCFFTAKCSGFTCVTNDKNLRRLCEQEGVPIMWGLEVIAELHRVGGITRRNAEALAAAIAEANPMHMTDEIISRFLKRIRGQET
jgi:rRNA-processing protein FCF1